MSLSSTRRVPGARETLAKGVRPPLSAGESQLQSTTLRDLEPLPFQINLTTAIQLEIILDIDPQFKLSLSTCQPLYPPIPLMARRLRGSQVRPQSSLLRASYRSPTSSFCPTFLIRPTRAMQHARPGATLWNTLRWKKGRSRIKLGTRAGDQAQKKAIWRSSQSAGRHTERHTNSDSEGDDTDSSISDDDLDTHDRNSLDLQGVGSRTILISSRKRFRREANAAAPGRDSSTDTATKSNAVNGMMALEDNCSDSAYNLIRMLIVLLTTQIDFEGAGDPGDGECILLARDSPDETGEARIGDEGITQIVAQDDSWVWSAGGSSSLKRWRDVPPWKSRAGVVPLLPIRRDSIMSTSESNEQLLGGQLLTPPRQESPVEKGDRATMPSVTFLQDLTSTFSRTTSSPTQINFNPTTASQFTSAGRPSSLRN
ncbi:hypothetical protein P7C70_g7923, partial [Phenoliferia sp. Uapishka_3]